MKHPSWDELSAYVDNALDTHRWASVARHINDCRECSDQISDLQAEARALRRTLEQDPGDAYFANFPSGVDARIDAEIASRTRAPGFVTRGWAKWWETPQGLTLAGTAAALVVAAGVVLMLGRGPGHVLTNKTTVDRLEATAPAEPPAASTPPGDDRAEQPVQGPLTEREEYIREGAELRSRDEAGTALGGASVREADGSRAKEQKGEHVAPATEAGAAKARADADGRTNAKRMAASAPAPMSLDARRADPSADVRVCGEVRDAAGQPLRFATITLRARNVTVASDDKGRFCLYAAPGTDSVIVTLAGYQPLRRVVTLRHDMPDQVVSLQPLTMGFTSNRGGAPSVAQRELGKTIEQTAALVTLPDSIKKIADYASRLTEVASRSDDARQYDAAAEQWQRLLRHVQGGPLENETRAKLAEMRYHAWNAEPTDRRTQAAREALTAFLVRAPIGAQRNRATLWLDQVAK